MSKRLFEIFTCALLVSVLVIVAITDYAEASEYTCLHRPLYDRQGAAWVHYVDRTGVGHWEHPTNYDPLLTIRSWTK